MFFVCGLTQAFKFMAISRSKKESVVQEMEKRLKEANIAFFIDFTGIKTAKVNDLRSRLRKFGASYKVVKKTLAEIAFRTLGFDFSPFLSHGGSLALITAGENEIEIAKALASFKKENETLTVVGGFLGKTFLPKEKISFLAKIPSREVLLGQLAVALNSPIRGLAVVLNGNLQKLAIVLAEHQKRIQREAS